MKENKTIQNYLVFQEVFSDTMGVNFRVGVLENKRPVAHRLMCQVNPLISTSPERLRRVKILLDGIKKAAIPSLFSPLEMVTEENQLYLVYDAFKGRNLEKIFDDAAQKGTTFSFDLAFSIAISVADIIESGSTIVISGEKSFHGFLTPDNILFNFDGKISLKNYGIFPYLDKTGSIYSEMETRYGNWLTPEFTRKEKIVAQSDVYHLGYIIYRMLTGRFFALAAGEDFDAKLTTLNLKQYVPASERDFHVNLINFFRKTLHPDPMKRFLSIKDFKDYIANYFHIEELSSITFNVAYFMNSLYAEVMEREEKQFQEELALAPAAPKREAPMPTPRYEAVPERKVEERKGERKEELVSSILESLDKEKKKKSRPMVTAAIVLGLAVVLGGGGYLVFNQIIKPQKQKASDAEMRLAQIQKEKDEETRRLKEEQMRLEKQREQEKLILEAQLADQKKLTEDTAKALKKSKEEQDKKTKEEEDKRLAEEARIKQEEAEKAKKAEEAAAEQKRKEDEAKRLADEKAKIEAEKAKPGSEVPYARLDVKPVLTKDLDPGQYIRQSAIWTKRTDKFKGTVQRASFRVLVDENGKVISLNFIGATPPPEIRELILEISQKWIYTIPQKDGVRVKTWMAPRTLAIDLSRTGEGRGIVR